MNVGWIGLGSIGTEMVKRLLGKDFTVRVFERGRGLIDARSAGASTTSDYRELAATADMLFMCVYSDDQLKGVLFDQGVLAAIRPGSILAIHTTGSPALVEEIQAKAPRDVSVLDATFSGGGADVAAGRLTLMVGGAELALQRARPALASYASEIFHMGGVGQGQRVKLLNNLLFATNLMNAAEMLKLAEAQGFDVATVAQVVQSSSGASFALNMFRSATSLKDRMASARPYLEKDVATVMRVTDAEGLDNSAFKQTAQYFRTAS